MTHTNVLGFPGMLGVRDLIFAARRVGTTPAGLELKEMDMDDMFWEIPQPKVISLIRWLISMLHTKGKPKLPSRKKTAPPATHDEPPDVEALLFSISKSGDKSLDKVGKSPGHAFRLITEQIIRFLHFNMRGNTLLVSGRILLQQGQRGVPIGEFLSAQLAEICGVHSLAFQNTW